MLIAIALSLTALTQAASGSADSLTLAAAIDLGRARAVNAAIARLGTRVAEARVGQRRADLLPNVAGSATVTRQTLNRDEFGIPVATGVSDPFSLFHLRLRLQQTIYDPAAYARLASARDSVVAAGLDAVTAGMIGGAAAGVAFLRALSADETVIAREADSAVAARLLDQARDLNRSGITPAIDVTRSEVNFATARSELAIVRNRRDRARLDLLRAIDAAADTTLVLARAFDGELGAAPASADAAAAFARTHRSEVLAERERLGVLERGRAAIRAENLPSAVASATVTESGRSTGGLAGSYLAQVGVAVPILDGWRRQLRSREQGLRIEAQAALVADLERKVDIEARQAVLDYASAAEQVALAVERSSLAQTELRQAEERFQAGVAGSIETTTAQAGLVAARDGVIQARVARGIARVALFRALGILEQLR